MTVETVDPNPDVPPFDDDEDHVPRHAVVAQRWHERVARAGVLKVAIACALFLAVAAFVHARVDARARRGRLIAAVSAERGALGPHADVVDAIDAAVLDLAREPFAGTVPAVEPLDPLLSQPGLYLRALHDEVGSPRAIRAASRASRKDAFVACVSAPPKDRSAAAIHRAATALRWRPDLDEAIPHVLEHEVLDRGLRVASRAFLAEAEATWDPTALLLLERERLERSRGDLDRALGAARARWAAIVIDELPTGFAIDYAATGGSALAETMRTSRLDDVLPLPHAVRVVLVDLPTRRVVARVRTTVDARDVKVANVLADAEEVHGCQAALALRDASSAAR